MQSLQSGDEKGQQAFAISDGGIGINLAGMMDEGMTVQRLALLSWGGARAFRSMERMKKI